MERQALSVVAENVICDDNTGDLIPGKPCNKIDKDLIKTFL